MRKAALAVAWGGGGGYAAASVGVNFAVSVGKRMEVSVGMGLDSSVVVAGEDGFFRISVGGIA